MRFILVTSIAILAIATLSWFGLRAKPDPESHDSPRNVTVQSASPSLPLANGLQKLDAQRRTAAQNIRAAHVDSLSTQTVRNAPTSAASNVATTKPKNTSAQAQTVTDGSSPTPRKAAAELFLPYVEDDPRNVFLPSSVQYHAAVQGETSDPNWGPVAAETLRGYIESLFGQRFEIVVSDCRSDLCELQIAGRLGNDSTQDMHDLGEAIGLMKSQSWWTQLQFDQETGLTGLRDGRVLALWFFSRM